MELSENIEDTIKVLIPVISDAEAGVMLYGCTSGSFIHGLKWNEDLEQKMNAVSNGIPMLTTTGALLSAFTELNVKKISVVTPYPDIVNMKLQATLEESGFEVVSLKAKTFPTTGNAPLNASYNLAKEAYRTDADCLFISCTGFRAIENIDRLEQEIGKPVITSNQACMWACLNTLGYKEPVKGYGRLLNMIK